ncbi:hypothetical protein NKH73_29320 [Mesorhizobium sp. M0938]|uniref:hypothetical protein n=1 Tax=unclassified Mesorhizobium TaxID=325217 RepID=UPI003337CCBA
MAAVYKQRPFSPVELLEADEIKSASVNDLIEWARATFIAEGAALRNDDHRHLNQARIGALCRNLP